MQAIITQYAFFPVLWLCHPRLWKLRLIDNAIEGHLVYAEGQALRSDIPNPYDYEEVCTCLAEYNQRRLSLQSQLFHGWLLAQDDWNNFDASLEKLQDDVLSIGRRVRDIPKHPRRTRRQR